MSNTRILIVDDEKELREGICYELKKEGYDALCAGDASEGLSLMVDPFPLVIVDLRMPIMDGLDFIKLVEDKYPRTQFIVLTGHGDESDAIEAVKLHVFDYIKKGDLTIEKLLSSIEKAILRYKSLPKLYTPNIQLEDWGKQKDTVENIRDITSNIDTSLSDDISKMR